LLLVDAAVSFVLDLAEVQAGDGAAEATDELAGDAAVPRTDVEHPVVGADVDLGRHLLDGPAARGDDVVLGPVVDADVLVLTAPDGGVADVRVAGVVVVPGSGDRSRVLTGPRWRGHGSPFLAVG